LPPFGLPQDAHHPGPSHAGAAARARQRGIDHGEAIPHRDAARRAGQVKPPRLASLRRSLEPITLLLLITAQLADLATFGLAARAQGIAGEVGPLRVLYLMGGFGAVALAKLAGLLAMVVILEIYSRRTGHGRWLAILVACMGVFGALTNVVALL
jgi:hypothetical protein